MEPPLIKIDTLQLQSPIIAVKLQHQQLNLNSHVKPAQDDYDVLNLDNLGSTSSESELNNPIQYSNSQKIQGLKGMGSCDTQTSSADKEKTLNIKKTQSLTPSFRKPPESTEISQLCLINSSKHEDMKQLIKERDMLAQENEQYKLVNAKIQQDLLLFNQFIKNHFKTKEFLNDLTVDAETLALLTKSLQNTPLVVLTFASPLVKNVGKPNLEMVLLDYSKEFKYAIEGLKNTKIAVQVKQVRATVEKFISCLTDKPIGLHFSGHGISINDKTSKLVFETNDGCAHYLSFDELSELLNKTQCKPSFVVIMSCHSQLIGEIFSLAGIEHVICIKQNAEILDEACRIFSQAFYESVFKNHYTICQAFELAKQNLKRAEKGKFEDEALNIMMITKSMKIMKHRCVLLGPFPHGKVENLTHQPIFPFEVSQVDDFFGRQIEMQEIIASVLQNRVTTIIGMPGIGKTTISKSLGFFLNEREVFRDGIVYFSLLGQDQTSMLIQQMYLFFNQKRGMSNQVVKLQVDYEQMLDKIIECLDRKQVLIIIDNIEDSLRKDGQTFRKLLLTMLQKLPEVKVLTTSRVPINELGDICEKKLKLCELSRSYTVKLLEKKAKRVISDQEKEQLMNFELPQTPRQEIKTIEDHHLYTLLSGHPQAISLFAPLLQQCTLCELYRHVLVTMQSENLNDDQQPFNSLKVSLDSSVNHMRKTSRKAFELLCLLGLLPGGITELDLTNLWGSEEWVVPSEHLRSASLLVEKIETQNIISKNKKKFSLLPFMNKYAESLLDDVGLLREHERIVSFLLEILKVLFRDSGVESKRSDQDRMRMLLLDYETNIWSRIYRVCDRYREYHENDSRIAQRAQTHVHLLMGYSSVDEYEERLISKRHTDITSDSRFKSAEDPPKRDSDSSNGKNEDGPDTEQKRVRFSVTSDSKANNEDSQISRISLSAGLIKASNKYSSPNLSQVNEEERYISDSSKNSSARGSISIQSANDEFQPARLMVRNKTEGDLHVSPGTLQFVQEDEQENVLSPLALMKQRSSSQAQGLLNQRMPQLVVESDKSSVEKDQTHSLPLNLDESRPGSFGQSAGVNSTETPPESVIVSQNTLESKRNVLRDSDPFVRAANPMLLDAASGKRKSKRFSVTSAMLEPIQEKSGYLSKDGYFLVIYISVLVIDKRFEDALRGIRHICDSKLPDTLCLANLKKLKGLTLMFNRNGPKTNKKQPLNPHISEVVDLQTKQYKQSYSCFERATEKFQKQTKNQKNIGLAQCMAAQGYLLSNKSNFFLTETRNEHKLLQKATELFKKAKDIYKAAMHNAGQAYCCYHLGLIYKKLKEPYLKLFQEHQQLEKSLHNEQSQRFWIERYEGKELSLFVEIIDHHQLGLAPDPGTKLFPKKTQAQIIPKAEVFKKNVLSEEEEIERESVVKDEVPIEKIQGQQLQDKKFPPYVSRPLVNSRSSEIKQYQSLIKPSEIKNNDGINKARLRREDIADLKNKPVKPKKEMDTIFSQDELLPQSVDYSWAYSVAEDDVNFNDRQDKKLKVFFFDFKRNWEIEQFYRGLPKDITANHKQLKIESCYVIRKRTERDKKLNHSKFADQIWDSNAAEEFKVLLVQENSNTKFLRHLFRLTRPSQNPNFSSLLALGNKISSSTKNATKNVIQFFKEASMKVLQSDELPRLDLKEIFLVANWQQLEIVQRYFGRVGISFETKDVISQLNIDQVHELLDLLGHRNSNPFGPSKQDEYSIPIVDGVFSMVQSLTPSSMRSKPEISSDEEEERQVKVLTLVDSEAEEKKQMPDNSFNDSVLRRKSILKSAVKPPLVKAIPQKKK